MAQEAARELGQHHVESEHVLLGLIAEREGLAARALRTVGVDFETAYRLIAHTAPADGKQAGGQIPLSTRANGVIEFARDEAKRRELSFIGTEHLLLGLVKQLTLAHDGDVALLTLREMSIEPVQLSEKIEQYVPSADGGFSWMLQQHGLSFQVRGVQGAGWSRVLSLSPDSHLRRLVVRATKVAMDESRPVFDVSDLLTAFGDLPDGRELLNAAGVKAPLSSPRQTKRAERDWTRIDASEGVLDGLAGAEELAIGHTRQVVTVTDLLMRLAAADQTVFTRRGWDVTGLRSA